MLQPSDVHAQQLIDLVYCEARLLDARDHDTWNALFSDDAYYWVSLQHDQPAYVRGQALA
jgi:3-phenylpropionate/cinnamic acid dioxygenase small subunit